MGGRVAPAEGRVNACQPRSQDTAILQQDGSEVTVDSITASCSYVHSMSLSHCETKIEHNNQSLFLIVP